MANELVKTLRNEYHFETDHRGKNRSYQFSSVRIQKLLDAVNGDENAAREILNWVTDHLNLLMNRNPDKYTANQRVQHLTGKLDGIIDYINQHDGLYELDEMEDIFITEEIARENPEPDKFYEWGHNYLGVMD